MRFLGMCFIFSANRCSLCRLPTESFRSCRQPPVDNIAAAADIRLKAALIFVTLLPVSKCRPPNSRNTVSLSIGIYRPDSKKEHRPYRRALFYLCFCIGIDCIFILPQNNTVF